MCHNRLVRAYIIWCSRMIGERKFVILKGVVAEVVWIVVLIGWSHNTELQVIVEFKRILAIEFDGNILVMSRIGKDENWIISRKIMV